MAMLMYEVCTLCESYLLLSLNYATHHSHCLHYHIWCLIYLLMFMIPRMLRGKKLINLSGNFDEFE